MDRTWYNLLLVLNCINCSFLVYGETYSVKIGGEHVNVVDKRFLSFTIDPKHLFSSVELYNSKECTCMASFLTPAYLRIAGPSTSHLKFENTSFNINNIDDQTDTNKSFFKNLLGKHKRQTTQNLKITNRQWREFMKWTKTAGFDIVFALNNKEKTRAGMWSPNSTLALLSMAEKANVENIVWQLGSECNNQTIDEYLNDLETLLVAMETVQGGKGLGWRAGGGDVTNCLRHPSDFRDYVTLAVDMSLAVLLNGNSSYHELQRMTDPDRYKLLTLLHRSESPLWITEHPQYHGELERAADWIASLGYSARNGFSVHFRELMAEELYEPTLSFYMALLYKNLVGERVLPVDFDSSQTTLFAHCTSLRHKPVPRAVTVYGVNMDEEPARLSLKLGKQEDGGEIMQFIMSQDDNGNIVVNGHVMSNEGDIRHVVKRVRPYKTLLINLPPKSIGFWVLANTNIEACQDIPDKEKIYVEAERIDDVDDEQIKGKVRRKRFAVTSDLDDTPNTADISDDLDNSIDTVELKEMIENLNTELINAQKFLKFATANRFKRQTSEGIQQTKKTRKQLFKPKKDERYYDSLENKPILSLLSNLIQLTRNNNTKLLRRPLKTNKYRIGKKYYYDTHRQRNTAEVTGNNNNNILSRNRRSVLDKLETLYSNKKDSLQDNEIDVSQNKAYKKLWNELESIQNQLHKISIDTLEKNTDDKVEKSKESEKLIIKTEISDDSATINFREIPNHGMMKTTFENAISLLSDLNKNLNRFWGALNIFE